MEAVTNLDCAQSSRNPPKSVSRICLSNLLAMSPSSNGCHLQNQGYIRHMPTQAMD